MNSAEYHILKVRVWIPFLVIVLLTSSVQALLPSHTFSLRNVAELGKDVDIIAKAKTIEGDEVYKDGCLVAKWFPVIDGALANVEENTSILKRRIKGQNLEVLVLLSNKDVEVKEAHPLVLGDKNGHLSMLLDFDEKTNAVIPERTKNNMGHCLAIILDGFIYTIQKIEAPLSIPIEIKGDFNDTWLVGFYGANNTDTNVNAALPDSPGKPEFDYSLQGILLALVILIIIWRLLVFVIRFVQKGKISMVTFGLCSLGGISGAILLGYRKHYAYDNNYSEIYYSISILWTIIGALLGILVMYIIYRLLLLWEKRVNNSRTKENQE